MINLSILTDEELTHAHLVFNLLNGVYDHLIDCGAIAPDDEYSLDELLAAIDAEQLQRTDDQIEFLCESAVAHGQMRRVVRPDGQIGYCFIGELDT